MSQKMPGGPYRLMELEINFPWIPWREPQSITLIGSEDEHFGCRVCIANHGLKGKDVPDLPSDPEVVRAHIAREHQIDGLTI